MKTEGYEKLKNSIRKHDYNYYVKDDPDISDHEYDELFRKLLEIEKDYPDLITQDSPSQRVGITPETGFVSYSHKKQMLSLSNVFSPDELKEFFVLWCPNATNIFFVIKCYLTKSFILWRVDLSGPSYLTGYDWVLVNTSIPLVKIKIKKIMKKNINILAGL